MDASEYAFCLLAVSHSPNYAIDQYLSNNDLLIGWPAGVDEDTSVLKINHMMHEAHISEPSIRAKAIEILAGNDGDKRFVLKSKLLEPEQAKAIAHKVVKKLRVKFDADAVINSGCTWFCDHTHDQPLENPSIDVMELNNDVENQLIKDGWIRFN
jgi:hypothetical protein